MEALESKNYVSGSTIRIPKLGYILARGPFDRVKSEQKLLRVIRRESGWYAQVLVEFETKVLPLTGNDCGIDLGLEAFATLDTGERIENPRFFRTAQKKLKHAQQRLSRRVKGSKRREKARKRVAKIHERIGNQRRGFCHRTSRDLVNRFDRIAYEDLNVGGMACGHFAKSIHDAAWTMFILFLVCKAAWAGKLMAKVDPKRTSQECPDCGVVKAKSLSERTHSCPCGCKMPRDQAAGIVIKRRAFGRAATARGDLVRPAVACDDGHESMKRADTV